MNLILVLGNQLFDPSIVREQLGKQKAVVFMREDEELCTYYRFHKHKLIMFLSAMRQYREELEAASFPVEYQSLDIVPGRYEEALLAYVRRQKIERVFCFEIEDKFFEERITRALQAAGVSLEIWPSPMFLTGREQFEAYLRSDRKPFMKTFYESQRRRLKILMRDDRSPEGGKWSFDAENRLPLPSDESPPAPYGDLPNELVKPVAELVERRFASHPGSSANYWVPVCRAEAREWLRRFVEERLAKFGPYEDALATHSDFVYHSVLTPFLNIGLLTPSEVMKEVLVAGKRKKIPVASLEGFTRQIIGWREFVRGIYQNFSEEQAARNFFQHHRRLSEHWYTGDTGIAPLDNVIRKVIRLGYSHHIERLMVLGSLMTLLEVSPTEAHRWFMEMYVDSSDWVMGPNVYGMAIFSDGGIFATKPYICGSNYYRKMGPYKAREDWCDAVDGLYWLFIEKHLNFFLRNPRLAMIARTVQKMDVNKKERIFAAAHAMRERITLPASS